jgi:tetratricopeptide (TPR) repeat protein
VQALLFRAQAAFDKKDYGTAQVLFTQATVLAPHNAVAWAGKARCEFRLGDYTDGVIDYTVAIHYAPTNAVYYTRRGLCYYRLANPRRALPDYSQAIRLAPKYADAYYDRGLVENELSLYQAAIADLTLNIRYTARAACGCAYNERGNSYEALHEYARALADYQQAIAIGPAWSGEFENAGKAAYYLGSYKLAISYLTTTMALNPADAYAYYYRGLALRDSGDKVDAITDEQKAVELYTQQGDAAHAKVAAAVLQQLQSAP